MVRALLLGFVMAVGPAPQDVPPGAAQVSTPQQNPTIAAGDDQPAQDVLSRALASKRARFRPMFATPPASHNTVTATPAQQLSTERRVICGMTIVPVDPTLDPKIRHALEPLSAQSPNPTSQPDFKILRIRPTVCRPPAE